MRTLHGRPRAAYAGAVGVASGMLLTGLILPFAVRDRAGMSAAPSSGTPLLEAGSATEAGGLDGRTSSGGEALTEAPALVDSSSAGASGTTPSGEPEAAPEAVTGATSAAARRTASDTGVTADAVKVGFLLLDIGGLDQIGIDVGVNVEQQTAAVQSFVDEVNERGGVNGRRIDPVYRPVNLLDQDAGRVACAELTQDHKVFISTGHLPRPEDVHCFTVQNRASLLTTNLYADEAYARSEGRLVTLQMRGSRLVKNWVDVLDRLRYIGDRTVGIVTDEGSDARGVTANMLKQALEAAGHEVGRVSVLARDYQTGSGQIPVEVSQMRTAGVEVVFFLANSIFAQQFAQQADGQGWRPRYTTSPWASMDVDTSNENMPASYDGTIGIAGIYPDAASWPEPPRSAECRKVYDRRSGRKLAARDTNEYGLTMLFCDAVHAVAAGLSRAGVNPTRASLAVGFQQVGRFEGLAWSPGGTFGPGKLDLLDHLRPQRWHADCKCFRPVGPYRRVRF